MSGYQSTRRPLPESGAGVSYHSLPALQTLGFPHLNRLPVSLRIVLESLLRNHDGKIIGDVHIRQLASWQPTAPRVEEIPFMVARVVLQDFTGVPLLADLAAMRDVAVALGRPAKLIEPLVPVDLVVDHSVMVDHFGTPAALDLNMKLEFARNRERYAFMKWGMQAFDSFNIVPPGIGIVHQVNLEYLAPGVHCRDGLAFPDSLVGTDSHTTMINGIGVVGWGVGGIEAEAAMLGQPVYFLTPDVVGVELTGALQAGVTATDLVLTLTELLRQAKVVGKFVEFFGIGTASLAVPDRATIANMAPEYGATMGYFPVDENTLTYLRQTGRSPEAVALFSSYFRAQGLFGVPRAGDIDYSQTLRLDLSTIVPSLAGPKRPQDRIALPAAKAEFTRLFSAAPADGGFALPPAALAGRVATTAGYDVGSGDVLIAAITSCTNTSNPSVILAAGLLAKKAVERGLSVSSRIKTSLAPGSRVVTDYLTRTGLLPYLEKLGFAVAAYGCTTCIGNSGDLSAELNTAIVEHQLVCAAVLSGNRNFEARIHPNLKANFLASPPLVVAYALAGSLLTDLTREPLAHDAAGQPVWLHELWPTPKEIATLLVEATDPAAYRRLYADLAHGNPLWSAIHGAAGDAYGWPPSTYIARPPFLADFALQPAPTAAIHGARALVILGDSVTTDHISPAGSIKPSVPAGEWLQAQGVAPGDFNSYGARRGQHEVMVRGTFANVRLRNLMLAPDARVSLPEGGFTVFYGQLGTTGEILSIFEAARRYQEAGVPCLVFGGEEYGTGSSRDWAAKGTRLLGVRAVIARSFERIHRANLIGMGVLPLQFLGEDSVQSLGLTGDETFSITGVGANPRPRQEVQLTIRQKNGDERVLLLCLRIDTPVEVDYFRHDGILPYVLRQLLAAPAP